MSMTTYLTLKVLLVLLLCLMQHVHSEEKKKQKQKIDKIITTTTAITIISVEEEEKEENATETPVNSTFTTATATTTTNEFISVGKELRKKEESTKAEKNAPESETETENTIYDLYEWLKRYKRPQMKMIQQQQHQLNLQLNGAPLPPPPPFPHNFALSPFKSYGSLSSSSLSAAATNFNFKSTMAVSSNRCGGILKAQHGIIQTPNFPHKFATPLECIWIIDAGDFLLQPQSQNASIVVYLTQLYVLGGIKFTEYMYYSDDYKVPAHRVFTLTEDDVTQVAWIQFNSPYLEIRFQLATLDGTHLRALDRLLDVYGFNITYEVAAIVKSYQCNTLQCRFLGHCFAQWNFSSYYCSCFAGFSGIDCGYGPLCSDPHTNICQSGGTCKHIGDAAVTCHCPVGFKGTKCEIPDISEETLGCTANSSAATCHRQCAFNHTQDNFSPSRTSKTYARSGKTRYEVTIRLSTTLTALYRQLNDNDSKRINNQLHLSAMLEKHLSRVLRNFNITKISDLELISNRLDRLDITFHFFGIKTDSNRIREAIIRMVERGRIGNITLVSNYHLFDENPPLNLLDLTLNHKPPIREDSEFVLSCTAQGSQRMLFQWYKDGVAVNASKATREIWSTVLPPETKDVFTAILGITRATRLDEGIYTCKVTDWDVEQCRSMYVHIKSPPRLRVDPASVTLHKGDSLRVRCLSPANEDIKRYAQLGYSWTRNGILFQSDPKTVMWEDLYPDGSILKINNIQKSAEYSCIVSNSVKPVIKSVYITVIDVKAVHVCHADTVYGVRWPTSAPGGAAVVAECPRRFEGFAKRICEKRDSGNSSWLVPDYSNCVRDQLLAIYNKFHSLIAGFQQTNTSELLVSCWHYTIKWWKHFLPGEASSLINMLHELDDYLQIKGTQLEREMAAEIILHILDKVMQNTQSLNNQQQINKLQLLTQSAALNRETIAASQLATSTTTGAGAGYIRKAQASSSLSSATSLSSPTTTSTVTSSSLSSPAVSAGNVDSFTILNAAATFNEFSTGTGLSSTRNIAMVHENNQITIATKAKTKPATAKTDSISQQGNTAVSASSNMTGHNSILTVDEDSLSLERLNSLRIYMTSIKTLPFNLRIYGDDLFSDQLYMDIGYSQRLLHVMANNTVFATVISYKNLKSFLPKTYYSRGSDSQDSDYVLASRIIQTWLFQANRSNDNLRVPLDLPFESGHVEIIFQHEHTPKDGEWEAVCGHDYKATFDSTWRSDLCITKNLMENITRCVCPISGTYVVMLTKRISHIHHVQTRPRPVFVIISCIGCLLQSCSAFITLLPIWYNRHCAVTFLKMQFCFSTSSIMIVYLLGFLKTLPLHWQPVISSSLASLLLLGISTLIAIALVLHNELVAKKLLQLNNMTTKTTAIITRTTTAAATTTNSTSDTLGIIVRTKKEPPFRPQHQLDKCANKAASPTPPSCIKIAREMRTPNPASPTITVKTASNISVSNITQISTSSSNDVNSTRTNTFGTSNNRSDSTTISNYQEHQLKQMRPHQRAAYTKQQQFKPVPLAFSTQAGVSGAIVISWLLPLLYAIAVPLICTINGKWPQNWWIEVISRTAISSKSSTSSSTTQQAETNALLPRGTSFTSNLNKHFRQAFNKISSYTTTHQSLLSDGDSIWEFNVNKKHSRTTTNINTTFNLSNYKTNITEKISTGTTTSVPSSVTGPLLNSFQQEFFYNATDEPEPEFISLNFLIFVCVDVVFVVLFLGLFGILIKKFLWLWHKHCDAELHSAISHSNSSSPHKTLTYDLDKFHNIIQERIGLLYRLLGLLFIKLSVDTLFIMYSNAQTTSWWSYPFGLACIVLGFAVLSCFILKPECQLYNRHLSAATHSSKQSSSSSACCTLKTKTKLNSSKTSLEDNNYSSGAINTSINFYASHEKEKESESAAPLMLSLTTMPSLATLTAQSMELQATAGCQLSGFTMLSTTAALSDGHMLSQEQLQQQQFFNHYLTKSVPVSYNVCLPPPTNSLQSLAAPAATSASHCYKVLSGNCTNMITSNGGADFTPLEVGSTLTYYDAYANLNMPVACQLASFNGRTTTSAEANLSLHDFVELETLDILQGVGMSAGKCQSNTMVGICSASYQHSKLSQQQQQTVDRTDFINATQMLNPTAISSLNALTANISDAAEASKVAPVTSPYSNSIITTTSETTQTPKKQKRVTIREPTTHTFDPLLPTMVAIAGVNMSQSHQQQQQIPTPIITITNASLGDGSGHIDLIDGRAQNEINGNADAVILDRISHDLNYLLNGSEESKKKTQ